MKPIRIPYQGSKQIIAEKLLLEMKKYKPNAKVFIDLFGGGGSMSFLAIQYGYKVVYNEINTEITDFLKYTFDRIKKGEKGDCGLFPNDWYSFVNKQEFNKIKLEKTPYSFFIKICYSFGNNMKSYSFSKDIQEWKKQGHDFILFKNKESKERIKKHYQNKFDLFIDYIEIGKTWQDRRSLFVNIILKVEAIRVTLLYTDEIYNKYKDYTGEQFNKLSNKVIVDNINLFIPNIPKKDYKGSKNNKLKELKQLQQLQQLERLEQLEQLQQLQQLERLEQLEQLQQLERLEINNKSYDEIDLSIYTDDEVIIYCDPPYRNTSGYNNNEFDYDNFNDWYKNNDKTIFLSEYTSDSIEIYRINKQSLLSGGGNKKTIIEKLYVNKPIINTHQLDLFNI